MFSSQLISNYSLQINLCLFSAVGCVTVCIFRLCHIKWFGLQVHYRFKEKSTFVWRFQLLRNNKSPMHVFLVRFIMQQRKKKARSKCASVFTNEDAMLHHKPQVVKLHLETLSYDNVISIWSQTVAFFFLHSKSCLSAAVKDFTNNMHVCSPWSQDLRWLTTKDN